jgi:hypothetical protein
MKFTDPFSHKCPTCNSDLYTQYRHELFETILKGSVFFCKKCSSAIRWKANIYLNFLRIGFFLLIFFSICIPIVSGLTGFMSYYTLFFLLAAAISAILFIFNMLTIEVEKINR